MYTEFQNGYLPPTLRSVLFHIIFHVFFPIKICLNKKIIITKMFFLTFTFTFWSKPSIWLSSSSRILCTSLSATNIENRKIMSKQNSSKQKRSPSGHHEMRLDDWKITIYLFCVICKLPFKGLRSVRFNALVRSVSCSTRLCLFDQNTVKTVIVK